VFGLLWGLGSMTLGMSFAFIGLSLAYSLNYGAQIVTGSMVPMLTQTPGELGTAYGLTVLGGVTLCLVGVVACGRAAMLKERKLGGEAVEAIDAGEPSGPGTKKPRMGIGVLVAVASGVLCACYGVAASYGGGVSKVATEQFGNSDPSAAWAVMSVIVWGGAVSSLAYCGALLTKNRTWGRLAGPGAGQAIGLALAMALLHDGAIFLFGLGFSKLGAWSMPVGYPVFMSFAIIVGNFHGFRTGEWKGAGAGSRKWILGGIAILIAGVAVLGLAHWIKAQGGS